LRHVLDQREIATARKTRALAAQHRASHGLVGADFAPDLGQLPVSLMPGGRQLPIEGPHLDIKDGPIGAAAGDGKRLVA
jgi:hypothetical protein